jgi:ankyrin repeat protein
MKNASTDSNTSLASFSVFGHSSSSPKRLRTAYSRNEKFPLQLSTDVGKKRSHVALTNETVPSQYVTRTLQSMNIHETRRDPFSIAAAMYFLPYTENDSINLEVLKAVRQHDTTALSELINGNTDLLRQRNRFGETLAHLVARWGDTDMMLFLLAKGLPLNVRDCHGRSPLHNACLAIRPDMQLVEMLVYAAPELLLYPDDSGNLPMDLVRTHAHAECIQCLASTQSKWAEKLARFSL